MACAWLGCLVLPVVVPVMCVALSASPVVPRSTVATDSGVPGQRDRPVWSSDAMAGVSRDAVPFHLPQGLPAAHTPFSIDIECPSHEWPYSATAVLRNDADANAWYVTVDVVDGERAPLPDEIGLHTRITPLSAEVGQPFVLAPGLAQRVALLVDPSREADPGALARMGILLKWGRNPEVMMGAAVYPVDFGDWSALDNTGFRLERDGYCFENVGDCYGMSSTAALYYTGELTRPGNATSTFALARDEASAIIDDHQSSHANSLGTIAARIREGSLGPADLIWLQRRLRADTPVIAWLTRSRLGGAHAVLVRGLWVDDARNVGILTLYDPDHSYASTRGFNPEAFQVLRCAFPSGRFVYGEYSGFAFGQVAVIPEN